MFLFCTFTEIEYSAISPRRSPRVEARRRECETEAFVFQIETGKNNEAKLSNTSVVLHGLPEQVTLDGLKSMLKTMDSSSSTVFVPSNGLFWIRKGKKQLVALTTDDDLRCCFEEYNAKAIRIACAAVSTTGSGIAHTFYTLYFVHSFDPRGLPFISFYFAINTSISQKDINLHTRYVLFCCLLQMTHSSYSL